ncbi:50S ribosomal protein L10 [Candidatus Pacearchaeota archaeon]|nr:50S ribosomal protein L10 [Candidatus Pacearchaeota archaeon]|tara:strand:- start:2736 stop:3680 length:945 start_codon:yes stop_codon:yes gene_type:complete
MAKKEEKVENKDEKKISSVPEYKKKLVSDLTNKIKESKTVLIASSKGIPGSQFHLIKKKLREQAEMMVVKKSLFLRAIESIEKGALQNIKEKVGADIVIFFSNLDAFELSGLLTENQSPARAKAGDIAPEDINVEPGPTELMPGPAISELSGAGLKVAVENGKLAIKKAHTIVKAGEKIDGNVVSVLGKLGITPMKVGFEPIAAYSSSDDTTYFDIKIDKEGTLDALREAIGKSLNLSVSLGYVNLNNVGFFIAKAGAEAQALEKLIGTEEKPVEEEKKEEKVEEEKKEEVKEEKTVEEKKEGKNDNDDKGGTE